MKTIVSPSVLSLLVLKIRGRTGILTYSPAVAGAAAAVVRGGGAAVETASILCGLPLDSGGVAI